MYSKEILGKFILLIANKKIYLRKESIVLFEKKKK